MALQVLRRSLNWSRGCWQKAQHAGETLLAIHDQILAIGTRVWTDLCPGFRWPYWHKQIKPANVCCVQGRGMSSRICPCMPNEG